MVSHPKNSSLERGEVDGVGWERRREEMEVELTCALFGGGTNSMASTKGSSGGALHNVIQNLRVKEWS